MAAFELEGWGSRAGRGGGWHCLFVCLFVCLRGLFGWTEMMFAGSDGGPGGVGEQDFIIREGSMGGKGRGSE